MLASALLSLVGACVIMVSALRFRELSKRFFAIRLIFFLALTDAAAAFFNILGVFVDVHALLRPDGAIPFLCALQAVGLLYFNLASIMWTSCFAFVRTPRRLASPRAEPLSTRTRGASATLTTRMTDCARADAIPRRGPLFATPCST